MRWRRFKSPFCRARGMWHDISRVKHLSPHEFRKEFERIYHGCHDLKTLWQLGGATNDYLRTNPHAIDVPIALPRRLLAAHHLHARIIGLKLLNRTNVSDTEMVHAIAQALRSGDAFESCGGIFESLQFLDRRDVSRMDASLIQIVRDAVTPLVGDGVDIHSGALHVLDRINDSPDPNAA
jgi:hypothetical protein